jgi:hypothetical protein
MYQQTDSDGLQRVIRLPIQPLLSVGRAFSGSVGTLPIAWILVTQVVYCELFYTLRTQS